MAEELLAHFLGCLLQVVGQSSLFPHVPDIVCHVFSPSTHRFGGLHHQVSRGPVGSLLPPPPMALLGGSQAHYTKHLPPSSQSVPPSLHVPISLKGPSPCRPGILFSRPCLPSPVKSSTPGPADPSSRYLLAPPFLLAHCLQHHTGN